MKILSVNTGKPRSYTFEGVTLETSMVRQPQSEIEVRFDQVVGDVFSGPQSHGVPEAVVYAFSQEQYVYWSEFLGYPVKNGFFGENLTLDSLSEADFYIADKYTAGECLLRVTCPRYPCNRLNFVSQNRNTREQFAQVARPGVYFQVLREGVIRPGDRLELKQRHQDKIAVIDIFTSLRKSEKKEPIDETIRQVLASPLVMERYKKRLRVHYKES
jgi:MOSC domain-containing protein YiiM